MILREFYDYEPKGWQEVAKTTALLNGEMLERQNSP
jgi:hypothetical protein